MALMMPDHVVDLLIPPLLERVAVQAPNIGIDVKPWLGPASMTAELARSVDLVIGCTDQEFAGFHRQRLFADTEAIAVRRGHPAGARLSRIDEFLRASHVAVVGQAVGRGQREDPIDTWLAGHRIERRIGLVVPGYLQALHIVSNTDLVAFIPRRLIEALAQPLSLMAVAPPFDPGNYEEFLFHPARLHADPCSIWLRTLVKKIGQKLDRSPRKLQHRRPAARALYRGNKTKIDPVLIRSAK
jgi:DNA-binding transcriptional LysR family regulator